MAETEPSEPNCVYVDTNLGTRLLTLVHNNETVSDFKERLCKDHHDGYPKFGKINISAVKVYLQDLDYLLPDYMCLSKAFKGVSDNPWIVSVEVDKCEELMDADALLEKGKEIATGSLVLAENKTTRKRKLRSPVGGKSGKKPPKHELIEKNKEIASDSLLLEDGCADNNQTPEEDLETPVVEKTRKKRKLNTLDGETSLKKPLVDVSQSAAAMTVDGSHELCGNVASESSPREKLDDIATGKDIEMGEKSVEDLEGDKPENNDLVSHQESLLDTNSGLMTSRPAIEKKKRRKKRSEDDINQSVNELAANVVPVDATTPASLPISRDNPLAEATQKENDIAENSVDDVARDKTETDNLASHTAIHPDSNSLEKSSNDDIDHSFAAAATNQINEVPANVDPVDATPESLPISRGENLDIHFAEASQKDNEMVEKSVEDVGRDHIETDNIASRSENHLDTHSGLTTRPDTEKKKRRKKRSKDDINQSSAATAATTNQIIEVPANVDPVDATPESLPISREENLDIHFAEASQKENEMVEKSVEDVGRDDTETDNIASRSENHLDTNSGLTTRPDTEKKKKRKKRSKDDVNGVPSTSITTSRDIVNEINGVPSNVDPVDATPAALPISGDTFAEPSEKGNEMVAKIDDDVGSGKAIPSASENIQTNNVEVDDADETKSVKPSKKKSKRAKTSAKEEEDTMFASGAQKNVEVIEAVDGEGTDNVIRNVLDSLQEKNETEGDLDRTGKKPSKKAKKKQSSKVVESQVEVNNAAMEETPLTNNPKDTDALLFTPVKKVAESDASPLKKSSEVAEDKSLSKKTPLEKVDMGDNFGCSPNQEKQDQVAGGAKSKKKEKKNNKGLDLHPSGSIAGSLNSVRPKEKKARGQQPANSGASHLKSMVKSGSVKTTVSSRKKQEVKKGSKPVVVENKRKTNFFENADKCNSSEDEYTNNKARVDDVSTKTPSDYSSDNDSDVTSMSRKQQGNNLSGGANKFEGSLQDLLRRSSSYKKALIRAQSQPDIDDDSPVDCVPDSQGV